MARLHYTKSPGPPRWVSGGPTPGPPTGSDPSAGSRTVGGGAAEADVGPAGESTDEQSDGQDDGQDDDGSVVVEDESSISEEDDGTGPLTDDETPGERRDG